MAETILWTFQDIVEQLLDEWVVPLSNRNKRMARQAVMRAYRDLPNKTRWSYLDRRTTIKTTASQSTGTVDYDHTGGTYENQLTLSGATWPDEADFGRVVIADTHYKISERKSSTVVTLDPNNNPGSDLSSQSYTWYRGHYPLPVDFRKIGRIFDVDNEHEIAIVLPDVHHAASIHFYDSPDTPWQASIRNHGEYYNSLSLEFGPPPDSAREYDLIYEAMPHNLSIEKYSTGTVTVSAGLTGVTGSGTVFPTGCVGSVIRLSGDSTNEPTSVIGSPDPYGTGTDNPYVQQRTIVARNSDTSLTVDRVWDSSYGGVKYTISDPIDLEISAMFTAFYRLAEYEFANLTRHEDRGRLYAQSRQAIREAMEADQRSTYSRGGVRYNRFSRVNVTTDSS